MKTSKYRIQANRTKPHIWLERYPSESVCMWVAYGPSLSVRYSVTVKLHILKSLGFVYSRNKIEGRYGAISKNENAHNNERKDIVNLALMRVG